MRSNSTGIVKRITRISLIGIIVLLSTKGVTAQIKVACIGNSITSGYQSTGVSYVPKLQALLGSGYILQNDGVSGTTLLKKGDNSYWNNGLLSQALAFKANIITIKLGTNDTKLYNWDVHGSEFKKDYEALIDTLSKSSVRPEIYLVLPVPVFFNTTTVSWGIRDSIIKKIIPIIKQIATERRLTIIDANTPLREHPEYFAVDGIHPDEAGADTIAHVIYRSIKSTTPVVSFQNTLTNNNRITSQKVYNFFNKNDFMAIFSYIEDGHRYRLSTFTANGVLQFSTFIDASKHSQIIAQKRFIKSNTLRFVVLKECR